MLWLIGGVIMAAVVTVMFLRGGRRSNRLSSLGPILRAPLYRNSTIFFGPEVIRENVLEPSLLTNAQTFYSPTIEGSASLIASLVSNSNTFYAPHLKQNIIAGLTTNAAQFFSPSVSGGTALLPALFSNSNTFYAPALKLSLKPPRLSNSQSFFAPFVSLGSVPGYILTTPGVSVTSAAGAAPEVDLTINSDHHAGFYLDIQRSTTGTKNTSDGSYTSATLDVSHQITPQEVGAGRITNTNLASDTAYADPTGSGFQQYRIRREDGALSQWVEITYSVNASVAKLSHTNGTSKNQYLIVSQSTPLQWRGTATVGANCGVRATAGAVDSVFQFEVTITSYVAVVRIGVDDGTTNFSSGFPIPGQSNSAGVSIEINATSIRAYWNGALRQTLQSSGTAVSNNDVFHVSVNQSTGVVKLHRNGVQVGSDMSTGLTAAKLTYAWLGTTQNAQGSVNFGATSFDYDDGSGIYA